MGSGKRIGSWKGRLFFVLFSLPFAGGGLTVLLVMGWCVVDWARMRSWEEVPCRILSAKLEEREEDDSTTYLVTARYAYSYRGQNYIGERVALHTTADNIGSYHQDRAKQLEAQSRGGRPFRCFVNPAEPGEAVLFRELRPGLLALMGAFALVFGGFGFGLLSWTLHSVKSERREKKRREEHPEEPWKWSPDWADGRIKSSTRTMMIASALFALFWNLISSPLLFVIPGELEDGNRLTLIALLFPAVGLGLIVWAVRSFLRWNKYGESTFEMANVPGIVGGPLAGVVYTNIKLEPEEGFRVTLSCVEEITTGSGKNRSTRQHIHWQDERLLKRELTEGDLARSAIPVFFAIPHDARESTVESGSRAVHWKLNVQAAVPGIDFEAEFRVPVFRTPESSPDYEPPQDALAEYEARLDPADLLLAAGVYTEPIPSGRRFKFPMAFRPAPALGLTVFLAFWVGAIWLMVTLGAPTFMPVLFAAFGLLILWGAIEMWFWTSEIEVQHGVLRFRSGIAGLGKTKSYAANQISHLAPRSGMQAGNRLYFGLELATLDGKRHTLAKRLSNRKEAEQVIEAIKRALEETDQ